VNIARLGSLGGWRRLSLRSSSAETTPSARSLPQERQSRLGKGPYMPAQIGSITSSAWAMTVASGPPVVTGRGIRRTGW
jgi:hypothetical protein